MDGRRVSNTAIPLVLLAALGLGLYFVTQSLLGSAAPDPVERAKDVLGQDQLQQRFEGKLGDFVITKEANVQAPCPIVAVLQDMTVVKASELYSSVFGENVEAGACSDGRITSIVKYGEVTVSRFYFLGDLQVALDAPRDRIKLMTIAGKPAIAELPVSEGLVPTTEVVVIERPPQGRVPGIALGVETQDDLDKAIAVAKQVVE